MGRDVHEVGMLLFDLVEAGLDVLHVVDIFDQALFAGRDDQPLFAVHQRNLGDLLNRNEAQVILGDGADVDERAQAIVLAEIAARGFVARGAVFDLAHRFQSDKRSLLAVAPQAQRLHRRTNGSRLAAEFVDDDFRLLARGAEAVIDEVHFRFHHRHVVLRPALQHETRSQRREIGNAGHVQEHILGKHGCKACQDFLRPPALPLEVHDVRLHEDGAAVAENRHGLSRECQIGILFDAQPKTFGGRLQEIAIARGALGIQLEIFDPAVVQDDDLDVLPAHVDDDVRIFVKLERRLGVRHGLYQRDVGVQDVFQNVLRIAGGGHSQDFQLRVLRFHLAAQVLEHFDRVLNRISVRELVGLAQNVALLIEQNGFGGSRAAVDADEAANRLAFPETSQA